MATSHIQVRDARDRLIDLLGIGQTYPLQDLAVLDEQLTVAFNTTAKIPIENSQKGVVYQLHYKHEPVRAPQGTPGAGQPIEAAGDGGTILLETYKIQDDITFEIFARKQLTGRSAYLYQTATVKVGLDVLLGASIQGAQLLDPADDRPTAPRIVDYGASVEVAIERSQEGVDYRLVAFEAAAQGKEPKEVVISTADVRGDLHTIVLSTRPVGEDTDIRIRATKVFDASEHRPTQTALLEVVLPLKVRANPALALAVDPAPIIGFSQPATIRIVATQPSASYQLYIRPIRDRDFIRQEPPGVPVIEVGVEGEPAVRVAKPPRAETWQLPDGYAQQGETLAGTGGDLRFTVDALTQDSLAIVRAEKIHQLAQDSAANQSVPSAIQLEQSLMILVRPNQAPALRIRAAVDAAGTIGQLQLFDGQPGVFYYVRGAAEGHELGLPAYFHQRDDRDARINKGLEQLAVEVDLAIPRAATAPAPSGDLAQLPPEPPILDLTEPVSADTALYIRAMKAQTRVSAQLDTTPTIPSGPEVAPEDAAVAYGSKTRVRIKASRSKEWYQLWLRGQPLADAVKGTGQDRLLDTGELREDTTFELLIAQPDLPIVVERVRTVTILVRPNSALQASAADAVVDANASTEIRIDASERGVSYQLMVGEDAVGAAVEGTDETIALTTGPLTADTTFGIRATKVAHPDLFVDLDQRVAVQVKPAPG